MSNDCIFCKIINNEIPCSQVYEDNKTLAFLDIRPINKGHILVIPKKHFNTILDIPDNLLKEIITVIKKISKSLKKSLKADGFNIMISSFPAAGQEVMHAHFHIIPRFAGDGLTHWPGKEYEEGEMDTLRKKIATFL